MQSQRNPGTMTSPLPLEPRALGFCCRVTTGMQVVAVIECIFMGISLISNLIVLMMGGISSIVAIVIIIAIIVCTVRLFYAVKHENPAAALPYLIAKGIQLGLQVFVLVILGAVLGASDSSSKFELGDGSDILVPMLIGLAIYIIIGMIFWIIVFQGRKYLIQKDRYNHQNMIPLYGPTYTVAVQHPPGESIYYGYGQAGGSFVPPPTVPSMPPPEYSSSEKKQ